MFEIPLEERNKKQWWVEDKKVSETETIEDETGKKEFIILSKCATCSRVIHKVEDIAALCGICDGKLCSNHATECFICKKLICGDDSKHFQGNLVCRTHSLFQKLVASQRA